MVKTNCHSYHSTVQQLFSRLPIEIECHISIFVFQVAPMKALCSERFVDWKTKFEPFGLKCKEVTGDSELDDYYELQNIHMIMTTPVSLML